MTAGAGGAARHHGASGAALTVLKPGDVRLASRDRIGPADGHVVVEPDLVGLCGTDLEIIDGLIDPAYIRYPVVLGHEWTGLASGPSPLAGRRVVVEGVVGCGHCDRCAAGQANLCRTYDEIGFTRDGAAASQIAVPAGLVHPLAPEVAADDAVLTEPAAVVYRGLARAGVAPGCRALVVGDGTIALLAVLLLALWSPAEIAVLGKRGEQASLAAAAGATSFDVAEAGSPGGFDLVVEAAGATDAVAVALGAARRGGTVLLLGLPPHGQTVPLAADDTVNNDMAIIGSFSYTSSAWRAVVALLNAGRLKPSLLITHRYPLADWEQAIATLRGVSGGRPPGPAPRGVSGHRGLGGAPRPAERPPGPAPRGKVVLEVRHPRPAQKPTEGPGA